MDIIIFGQGSEEQRLRSLAQVLPNVAFHRHDDLKLARALRISAAVVIPGYVGLAVTHGFAHGVPTLTRRGQLHSPEVEYIDHGVNGLFLSEDPNEFFAELDAFVDDRELQRRLANGAERSGQTMNMGHMVDTFRNLVAECLDNRSLGHLKMSSVAGQHNLQPRRILIIVENLPVPFDRRVWSEASTLHAAGYEVSIICPKGRGYDAARETIDGIHIYRHRLPIEARGASAYLIEYSTALFWEFTLSVKVAWQHGFDVIHACNPPDLIFVIGLFYKIFAGKSFLFDHHDVNPEFYEAKFGRRGLFWRLLVIAEKLTFKTADISIATNESYRQIAIERGAMPPDRVFVVRSGPQS